MEDPSRCRCPIQRHQGSHAWRLRPARVKGRNCNIERYGRRSGGEEGQTGFGESKDKKVIWYEAVYQVGYVLTAPLVMIDACVGVRDGLIDQI